MVPSKVILRLARKLHDIWAARPCPCADPVAAWQRFQSALSAATRTRDQWQLAMRGGLRHTTARLRDLLQDQLEHLARQLGQLQSEHAVRPPSAPDLGEWVQELQQLEEEFGAAEVRWTDQVLRVVTESIVLEQIDLGPFAIELDWGSARRFSGARSFDVIALDPHPAAGRESVVHPHVEGRRLCPGDASAPLHQAVDEGRLADAFLLVHSALTSYNAFSAFVPLAEWNGFHCAECGRRGDPGARSVCAGCDRDLCQECSDACAHCSEQRCPVCLTRCSVCDDRFC